MARIGHVHLSADIRRRLIQRLLHGDEVVVVHFLNDIPIVICLASAPWLAANIPPATIKGRVFLKMKT